MFWLLLTVLALLGGLAMSPRRKSYESVEEEPWRASLEDDDPLDVEEARRAEEEWLEDSWEEEEEDDEPWRG